MGDDLAGVDPTGDRGGPTGGAGDPGDSTGGGDDPTGGDPGGAPHYPEPMDPDIGDRPAAGPDRGFRLRPRVLAAVAAGGLIGAPARYEFGLALRSPANAFPVATFLINVTGSFLLGMLLTLIVERWPPTQYVRPFAAAGILGAYTTWSTFMVEDDLLLRADRVAVAAAYSAAALSAGLVAGYAGILLVRRWPAVLRSGS